MAMPRVLTLIGGKVKAAILSIQASTGAADADKIIATGADGKLDPSFLPPGIGTATVVVPASEALSAGDLVDLYSDGGVTKARKADGATLKPFDGFVKAAVSNGANATVYPPGELNSQLIGLTPGADYYLSTTTPGGVSTAQATSSGQLWQRIGTAISATELQTVAEMSVELA